MLAKSNVREEIFILVPSFKGFQSIMAGKKKDKITQIMAAGTCGGDGSHHSEPGSKE